MRTRIVILFFLASSFSTNATELDPLEILERNCITCHNADDHKGDVILDRSPVQIEHLEEIIEMVSGLSPEMPKDRDPLSKNEIAALRKWVKSDAKIAKGRILEDKYTPGLNWWSLKPIQQGTVPDLTGLSRKKWARNEIDAFILTKLTKKKLTPSPEAEPRALIRRLFYNLTGLPPSPEQMKGFLSAYAKNPEATYSTLVDKLLDSPAYGEHWARHWLDVARYGETHGYDKDKPRPNAWPYRDYVISSFNSDKPWSRFVQEQIAGDALFPGTADGIVALGFIAAGPWDFISHYEVGEGKVDGRIAKHMDRDDMVSATFNAFMSITAQCAQCHDHKFDPVSMQDYYRIQSVFAAVDRAPRVYDLDPKITAARQALEKEINALNQKQTEIKAKIITAGGPELEQLQNRISTLKIKSIGRIKKDPEFGYHSHISKTQDSEKWVQIELEKPAQIQEIVLTGAHDDYEGIGAGFGFPKRFRVEIADDTAFKKNAQLVSDNTAKDYPNPGVLPIHFGAKGKKARFIRITATKLALRKDDYNFALAELQVIDTKGKNVSTGAKVTALDSIEAPPRWKKSNLIDGKLPVDKSVPTAKELSSLQKKESELLARVTTSELIKSREDVQRRLGDKKTALGKLPKGKMVYAAATHFKQFGRVIPTEGKPRTIHLLHRGDIRSPGDEMHPGAPALWEEAKPEFVKLPNQSEGQSRAALARYLTDQKNPLVWRSIVNRVWLWHFGMGIVDSPNDFGRMGMKPTHPELLDWLANQLRDDPKQSLKKLHRLIVTSATWRQSATDVPAMADIDGGNQYYWKANRRRLSAEELRDSVLVVAGKMNREMGGPSFQDFVIEKPQHSPHYQYHLHNHNDPKALRRSIYRMIARSQMQPFLTTLDCADPSQMVAKRDETTTALQALALMNNPFMETMAGHFADRVSANADPISTAFALTTGRTPDDNERSQLVAYAKTHGMKNACRVILNLSEFAYLD